MVDFLAPHEPDNDIKFVNELEHMIINTVPDIVVVDLGFAPGVGACRPLHRRYQLGHASSGCHLFATTGSRMLWYYPVCASILRQLLPPSTEESRIGSPLRPRS